MMLTSQQMGMAVAMKLAGDGKQNDPTALLVIIGIIAAVCIVRWAVDRWRWR